jgi:O-antigen/teichoic acid export membrane protein
MEKEEQRNAITYLAALVLQRASLFLFLPFLLHSLSASEYGTFGLLQSGITLLPTVLTLNIPATVTRLYFDPTRAEDREGIVTGLTLWSLLLGLASSTIAIVVLSKSPDFLARVLAMPEGTAVRAVWAVIAGAFGSAMLQVAYGIWRAKQLALRAAAANLLTGIVFLISGVVLAINGLITVETAITAYAGSMFIIGFPAAFLAASWKHLPQFESCRRILKDGLAYGGPVVPYLIGIWVLSAGGRWIARSTLDLASVGHFTLASQLAILVGLIGRATYEAWAPRSYELVTADRIEESQSYLRIRGRQTLLLGVLLAALISVVSAIALPRFYPSYGRVTLLFPLLALAPLFDIAHLRPHTELLGLKRTAPIGLYTSVSVLIFLGGGFLAARLWGIWGLSFAYVLAYLVQFVSATAVAAHYRRTVSQYS